jgi:hypothetical protein
LRLLTCCSFRRSMEQPRRVSAANIRIAKEGFHRPENHLPCTPALTTGWIMQGGLTEPLDSWMVTTMKFNAAVDQLESRDIIVGVCRL